MTQPIKQYFDYNAVESKEARAFLRKSATTGKALLKRTAQNVWELGQLLTEVQERIPYGKFGQWILSELGLDVRSAHNFVTVYRTFSSEKISELTAAPSVLYLLAAPSVEDETREVAVELIRSGDIKTTSDARAFINASKPIADALQNAVDARIEAEAAATTTTPKGKQIKVTQAASTTPEGAPEEGGKQPQDASTSETEDTSEGATDATPEPPLTPQNEPSSTTEEKPKKDAPPTAEERARALPLYIALSGYGHAGHLMLSAATAWYEMEKARNSFAYAHSRNVPTHASGTVFDEWKAFLRIPAPEHWEGCAACKGSTRVGDGQKCESCKGGFTTHRNEGVTPETVIAYRGEGAEEPQS